MRIIRVRHKGQAFYATIVSPESVRPMNRENGQDEEIPLAELELLSLIRPTKIVCVGLNYLDHARELGLAAPPEPILFLKPPSSLIGGTGLCRGLKESVCSSGWNGSSARTWRPIAPSGKAFSGRPSATRRRSVTSSPDPCRS